MTMTTRTHHTAGPWTIEAGYILASDGTDIADVKGGDGFQFIDDDDNAECLANARLIAAAPDLLAALEAWVESTCREEQTGSMRPVYDAAIAAIAKATT